MQLRLASCALPRALALALLASVLAPACRTQGVRPPDSTAQSTRIEPAPEALDLELTPEWVGRPLSWEKLETIERWLATQPADRPSFWRVEGELQLAQGRLELARREQAGKVTTESQLRTRVRSSRAGFERVVADPHASEGQRERARLLISKADKLLDGKRSEDASSPAGLSIVSRGAWGAAAARPERMEKNRGGWKRITVHHSAEEHADPLDGSIADTAAALRLMQKSHMESKSPRWGDLGYHFLIDPAGHVFQGRELTYQGAHADGDNNVQNIGVCLIGNYDEDRPSKPMLESLRRLLEQLRRQSQIPRAAVYGHQDLKNTLCPGKHVERWLAEYTR